MCTLDLLDLLEERPNGIFILRRKGLFSRAATPQPARRRVAGRGSVHYALWTHRAEFVRTGEGDAFEKEFGQEQFEVLDREIDPEYTSVCDETMTSLSRMETAAVREALDRLARSFQR